MFIGIDVGTSGTKTILCNVKGKILAEATFEYPCYSPRPGWSEQNPADWWTATTKGVKAVLRKAKISKNKVLGLGLSGQMHGSVFIDKNNKVIRRAILWNDQRTAKECAQIESAAGGRSKLISMVANPALTGFTAPKILWVRKNEPKNYERTKKILLPKDYVRFLMTGEYATEVSDAAGMLLLDVKKRSWHKGLLSKLKIDYDLLAKVYESVEVSGTLTKKAAGELGLQPGTPVVGGGGDNAAAAVGTGIVKNGLVSASIGTSGIVYAHSKDFRLDPSGRIHTFCSCVPDEYCLFGCVLSAGGSFQWFRNELAQPEVESARQLGVNPYQLLENQAAKAPPGCEGLYFLPYLTGERSPYQDPFARGAWVGLTARTDRAMMIRALLEGVTYAMADQIKIMRQINVKISRICATGGGGASKWWRQLQADIYRTQVYTINASAGAAYGVAILAMVGTGHYSTVAQACSNAIKVVTTVKPNPKMVALYKKYYALYPNLYHHLKDDFADMAKLVKH